MDVDILNYILQLKITKTIKENEDSLEVLKQKLVVLEKEKELLYNNNPNIIKKIKMIYLNEVKNG